MAKAMKEIARDVEYAIIHNATAVAGDGTTPGQMGGIPCFNSVNVKDLADAADFTETDLNDVIQLAWNAGGKPETVLCSGRNKRKISGFTASSQKTMDMGTKKLTQVIDVNVGVAA